MENIDVPFLDEIREELQEEGKHQQSDVHTVHIGIGSDDDFVVAQFVQTVFYIQRGLQAVELLVLINDRFGQSIAVKRFTAEREHRLCAYVTTLGNGARRRETLRDEDAGFQTQIIVGIFGGLDGLGVVEVNLTITQLGIIDEVLFRPLSSHFRHRCYRLTLFLRVLNLLQHHVGYLRMLVKIVIELLFDKVIDELINAYTAGRTHVFGAEFDFRLTLEDRFFHIDSYRSDNAITDVRQFLILIEKLLDRSSDSFAESGLVRTALDGMLTVHEREIFIAVLVGMRERNFYVFAYKVDNRI